MALVYEVEVEAPRPRPRVYEMPWAEVRDRLRARVLEPLDALVPHRAWTVFGVPRGGAVVAGLTGLAADEPAQVTAVVEDIIDSGRTRERWAATKPGVPFLALVDKTGADAHLRGTWVRFPWEVADPTRDLEDTVVRQLELIGEDPSREGLRETPGRYLRALRELTSGYGADVAALLKTFPKDGMDEVVSVRDVPFWSLCEHHLLPFHGTATVGYIPADRLVGLSKLPRLVRAFARRLQVQERLTVEIGRALEEALHPRAVGVVLRAQHTCMNSRGVQSPGAMVTQFLSGLFREDAAARAEFLALTRPA